MTSLHLQIILEVITKAATVASLFKVLDNLRYLGLILSELRQDFAMLLVIWPVLRLTFLRAVTYNFAPRTKLQKSLFLRAPATTGMARYTSGVESFEVGGSSCGIKFTTIVVGLL
jgi:hypothetical protein